MREPAYPSIRRKVRPKVTWTVDGRSKPNGAIPRVSVRLFTAAFVFTNHCAYRPSQSVFLDCARSSQFRHSFGTRRCDRRQPFAARLSPLTAADGGGDRRSTCAVIFVAQAARLINRFSIAIRRSAARSPRVNPHLRRCTMQRFFRGAAEANSTRRCSSAARREDSA